MKVYHNFDSYKYPLHRISLVTSYPVRRDKGGVFFEFFVRFVQDYLHENKLTPTMRFEALYSSSFQLFAS